MSAGFAIRPGLLLGHFPQHAANIGAPIASAKLGRTIARAARRFSKMSTADIIAYVDEAGKKGFIRNLTADRDPKVALFAALLFPGSRINELHAAFEPAFTRFKNEGGARLEKLHITEAYKPANEDLRPMAEEVRDEIVQLTDEMDAPIAKRLNVRMDEMRSISYQQTTVKVFDLTTRKPIEKTITFGVKNAPFPLDVTHLGQFMVVGKEDPLIFTVDVVANALNNHLSDLPPPDAALNAPSSIDGWILRDRVWGARDGAIEENIPAVW
jgi:hypothetical protein